MVSQGGECVDDDWSYSCLRFYAFSAVDYIVFTIMLVVSASVGVYFAYRSRRNETLDSFTLGGRDMHAFPTSLSIMCTTLSALTVIGTPAEFYGYGAMYFWMTAAYCSGVDI